jgi:radical SAM protein with 4Fe4S-binding SPASM domain
MIKEIAPLPQLLEIEPTLGCNLRCIMCHVPTMKEKSKFLNLDLLEKATEGLTNINVVIGSEFEPTIHPEFEKLLKIAIKRNWKLDFLTNATLLHKFDEAILREVKFNVFNVSFDGASAKTFESVRKGARYERVFENAVKYAEIARSNGAFTAISSTIMRSNIDELPESIRIWDSEGFDLVRLCVAQARSTEESVLNEILYPLINKTKKILDASVKLQFEEKMRIGIRQGYFSSKDFNCPLGIEVLDSTAFNPNSSYRHVPSVRQQSQRGTWPGMKWPCRSPFVYSRIRWDGAVDLCNNRGFEIGNIYEESFLNIWNGEEAISRRNKIVNNTSLCENCDYYTHCIGHHNVDLYNKDSYFSKAVLKSPKSKEWLSKLEY